MADVTPILSTSGLKRHFGGLRAVDGIDFTLNAGEIRAIIGPNGAGKTTFVSLLSGRTAVTEGRIAFQGRDITKVPAFKRVRLGIAYTFQITNIYPKLSVIENVRIAALGRAQRGDKLSTDVEVRAMLASVGLADRATHRAGEMAYGHQRLLEVAMGLALKPSLLILDEPTQGLSDTEIDGFCALVKDISKSATVLLIEHNMDVVMRLADRITVLNRGLKLAEGTPAEIRENAEVQAAYLGTGGVMLQIENLNSFYGNVQVLRDFCVSVAAGEILCLLGRNGAGKTTALKSILGLLPPRSGRRMLDGKDVSDLPAEDIPRQGIGYVPQGRRLFTELTVRENLEVGLMTRGSGKAALDRAVSYFPKLTERFNQLAGTLSGGEQSMVAIARALCVEPRVIMLDEPTEGLMPSMIQAIRDVVTKLRSDGVAVLLVEQRIDAVLPVADRIAFMDQGRVQAEATVAEVKADPSLVQKYLGVGHG